MEKKLLVIEDTPLHLTILAKIAAQEGFTVTTADSFACASKLLGEIAFDCITLDLSLGERSGIEVLRLLSQMNCPTPIVVISGSEHSVREETLKMGKAFRLNLCEPVPKPIDLAALRILLRQVATESRGLHTNDAWDR
jgi:DNA-binding response OmpR family regulator